MLDDIESTFEGNIYETLWKDVQDNYSELQRNPLLAHYTSIATLEKIVNANEIWFSNPLYMNDYEELRFGMLEGANFFKNKEKLKDVCETKENYTKLINYFDELFNEFDSKYILDTYVLCFTQHVDDDGSLSMWRGYGDNGNGAAIVFDANKIISDKHKIIVLDKVHYASREERFSWINNKLNSIAEILDSSTITDNLLFLTAYHWIERLKIFSLFTKHYGFFDEREWRLVYLRERDPENLYQDMFGYFVGNKGVEPKLKIKLHELSNILEKDLSLVNIVNRIILGPTISSVMAKNSVCRMLKMAGTDIPNEKIISSTIPFRN
jgi:hypothetical protein